MRYLKLVVTLYSKIYFGLAILTPIYALGGLALPMILSNGNGYTYDAVTAGIRLLIASMAFWIWSRIFLKFSDWIKDISDRRPLDRKDLRRQGLLMFGAFGLDVVDFSFRLIFKIEQESSVLFPQVDPTQPWLVRLFVGGLHLVKYSAELGPFITPRTFGLSTLLVGSTLFFISRSDIFGEFRIFRQN